MKKLKVVVFFLFIFLLLLGFGITLFLNLNPAFGGNPTKEQRGNYQNFNNYVNGKFVNEVPTRLVINSSDSESDTKDRNPAGKIPASVIGLEQN